MKIYPAVVAALALLFACGAKVLADITITGPTIAHTPYTICPLDDGGNRLNPDPVEHLPPPQTGQGVLAELANPANINFAGWTFAAGPALNGTLEVTVYQSHFPHAHQSGAIFEANYTRAPSDPVNLRFIQMAVTTAPGYKSKPVRYTSPYIDTHNDHAVPLLPFYWKEAQVTNHGNGYGMQDFTQREHPPTSSVVWRGYCYLVSWDGKTPGAVTIHDGVKWGFDAGCADASVTNVVLVTTNKDTGYLDFSWPTNSPGTNLPGWALESATNLILGAVWQPRTNNVEQTNGVFHTSLPSTQAQEFFRLSLDTTGAIPELQPAYIRVQPQSNTVAQGHEAYLSVTADGSLPIFYQWFTNGAPIPDATNDELILPHVQFANQGVYSVVVSNSGGSELSDLVQLQVVPDTTSPTLLSATASSNLLQISVTFSEPVDPATALNPANYQVTGELGPIQIMNTAMSSDPATVNLFPFLLTPLVPNRQYLLHVSGIADFAIPPNYIIPGSSTNFTTGTGGP